MAQLGRSVRTITICFGDGEKHHQFDANAWVYDSGIVMWEARRFVIAFYSRKRKDLIVCRILRDKGSVFELACRALGLDEDEARKDSLRSVAARDDMGELCDDPLVRQEYSWNTRFTFGAFMIWASHSKTKSDRAAGRNLLAGILRRTCGVHAVRQAALYAHLRAAARDCPGNPQGDMCPHQAAVAQLASSQGSGEWDICASLMVILFSSRDACPACVGGVRRLAWALERHCIDYLNCSTPARPNKIMQLDGQTGRKRRRFDEDYTELLSTEVQQGRILSASAVGKNSHDFQKGSCHDWRLEALSELLCEARKQYEQSELISICQDGVKAGNPLEETDCYLIWVAKVDNGFVLAPQAPS